MTAQEELVQNETTRFNDLMSALEATYKEISDNSVKIVELRHEIDRLTNRNALCSATVEDCKAKIDEMVRRWVK